VPAAYDHSKDDLAWVEHDADEALSASYAAVEADAATEADADAATEATEAGHGDSGDATVAEGSVPGSGSGSERDRT
jgi:hypothetical protein